MQLLVYALMIFVIGTGLFVLAIYLSRVRPRTNLKVQLKDLQGEQLWFQSALSPQVRIIVQPKKGTVTFEHCHRSKRFWTLFDSAKVVCGFSEILSVHVYSIEGGKITRIVTEQGKAEVGGKEDHEELAPIREFLAAVATTNPTPPLTELPYVLWVVAVFLALLAVAVLSYFL